MAECKHKFKFRETKSFWRYCGRNNREYYQADYYFCKRCLEEKVVEKRHSEFDGQLWRLPDWAKLITNKIE